ncbi:MAG: class I SAM-dependent methyltransferase [Gammaproteobacteria bacterium]|jgi:hypothetical protein|nr:class I SAM-dependent methyltransferase [Gammaproteobacteria bacterium]
MGGFQAVASTMQSDLPASSQACPLCKSAQAECFCSVNGQHYWRCPDCQLRFLQTNQRLGMEQELAHYQLHNNDPADHGYQSFLMRLAEPLLALLPAHCSGLDYGCGPGPALAQMLASAGHRMSVYDPLFAAQASVLEQQYDFITCSETAEHFFRPDQEFERLYNMLRPNGWLAVMTTLQTNDSRFANWHYRRDPTHVCFYQTATFAWLADLYQMQLLQPVANVILLHKR